MYVYKNSLLKWLDFNKFRQQDAVAANNFVKFLATQKSNVSGNVPFAGDFWFAKDTTGSWTAKHYQKPIVYKAVQGRSGNVWTK